MATQRRRKTPRDSAGELVSAAAESPEQGVNHAPKNGTDGTVPRHWLRQAETQWSPRRVVTFDSETFTEDRTFDQVHRVRCWAARLDIRDPNGGAPTEHRRRFGTTVDEFADWLTSLCRADRPVWCYAHNLGFDAIILQLPQALIERGWEVTSSHVSDGPVWWRLRRDRERLVLTDSMAFLPAPLAEIAGDLGRRKAPLPDPADDDLAAWRTRCETDVEILADAISECMAWWDEQELGRWSLTGTGLGWWSYRHRFLDVPVLIDPDSTAAAFERRANYGGRREAYRVGEWTKGRFQDIDFVNGYPQLATLHDLPARRLAPFEQLDLADYRRRSSKIGVIAECTITTSVPVVPCRFGETILYPTGQFTSVLTSPEIDLVLETGGQVEIGRGYRYQLAPTMRTWSTWVRSLLSPQADNVPPVVRRMVKHWSRAVFGRWTMRTTRRVELDAWPIPGVPITKGRWVDYDDADTIMLNGVRVHRTGAAPTRRVEGWTVVDGDRHFALIQDQDPDNTFPAVWCWVEALCRVALWRAMQTAGPATVWQCDTDGFILGEVQRTRARRRMGSGPPERGQHDRGAPDLADSLPTRLAGLEWAVKQRFGSLRVVGPQHLWLGEQRRMAGIARDAIEVTPGVFESIVWPSYMSQLRDSRPGEFVTPKRQQKLRAGINPRWVLANGMTLPVELAITDGHMIVCAPPQRDSNRHKIVIAPDQHGVLQGALYRPGE